MSFASVIDTPNLFNFQTFRIIPEFFKSNHIKKIIAETREESLNLLII